MCIRDRSNIALLNISRQNLQSSLTQAESAQEQMVISVETLFISYNSLEDQRDELKRSLTVLDANLRAAELQNELGMMTDMDLASVRQSRYTLTNSISVMEDQLRMMGYSINVMIGREYDAPLRILELPELTQEEDLKINHRKDLENALSVYSASSEMAEEQFKVSYENLYRDVEQMCIRDSNKRLYEAGILSKTEMDQIEMGLKQAEIANTQAQEALSLITEKMPEENKRQASDGLKAAQAQKDAVEAQIVSAQKSLEDASVTSPISGTVSACTVTEDLSLIHISPARQGLPGSKYSAYQTEQPPVKSNCCDNSHWRFR